MTTEYKHTPGPWRVTGLHPGDSSGSNWTTVVSDGAEFNPSFVCSALQGDACLIAAAPDLLACLESAEQAIRLAAAILEQKGTPLTAEVLRSRTATYAAAIAKATGKGAA